MEVINLTKIIDDQTILRDVSFHLEPGKIIGLLGRNGSGKTTLFRTIANSYLMDSGIVTIDGVSLFEDVSKRSALFFLDTQYQFVKSYTLKQIAFYYQQAYPTFDTEKYFHLLQKHNLSADHRYRSMSKGMRALLDIILAVSSGARFILLDEPFDGLDLLIKKRAVRLLLEEVSEQQSSVMISSHNLRELEMLVDGVVILKDQTVVRQYDLDSSRENVKKFQMVFSGKKIPELIRERGTIISIQGRVIVCVFENFDWSLQEEIEALKPALFEELPMSLEDLFASKLTLEEDYEIFE